MKITFIGFGNMAKAMAKKLVTIKGFEVRATAPSLFHETNPDGIATHSANDYFLADSNILILAAKPYHMADIVNDIEAKLPPGVLVISIAAGLPLSWFASKGLSHCATIRAMPNLGVATGEGAIPYFASSTVTAEQLSTVDMLFKTMGIVARVTQEEDLDRFTALSGSGPAYVFEFMAALVNAATAIGISPTDARDFTLQTVKGALSLALQSSESLVHLRNSVTSPKGTTEAALNVLLAHRFSETIQQAVEAALQRAREIGKNYQ